MRRSLPPQDGQAQGAGWIYLLAREMIGQRPACPLRSGLFHERFVYGRFALGRALGPVRLERLDGEFQLLEPAVQLLGRRPELLPLEPRQFEAQLLDQRAGMDGVLRHGDDHALERVDIVGELRWISNHANSLASADEHRHGVPRAGPPVSHPAALIR